MSTTITGLPNATTPLSGTERVPMDQAGATKDATTQDIANLAPGTDLSYSASTRQLSSSTGADVTLPVAGADAGLMSAADKSKLDAIASGATANATDAQLRDRSTHTGTQSAGTITGLATVATTGAYADLSGRPTLGTAAATDATAYATAAQGAKADTAVQPAGLTGYVQTGDARLSDSREWSAATIDQAEAEAGTATTRRAFTAQRVFQAVAAWWAASAAKTKLDGIAAGAEVNVNADWNASSGDAQILNKPTIPSLSDATPQAPGTAAAGTASSAARGDHVHPLPGVATTNAAGLMPASSFAAITYAADVELDMAALDGQVRTISLTGNLSLTSINRAAGRSVTLRLIADSTQRTLTFPSGWVFIGTKPANIAASKTGVLSLTFFGTASTDAVAAWGVQA